MDHPSCVINFVVFGSSFVEGDAIANATLGVEETPETGNGPVSSNSKRRFVVEEDYDIFHSILFYIYTDSIKFAINPKSASTVAERPNICTAEDIYRVADRLLLNDLKSKAVDFLRLTCTPTNIASRIMSSFADFHEEVSDMYAEYFRTNWDTIKTTVEFDQYFNDMKGDPEELYRVFRKFRKLMADSVFSKPSSIHPPLMKAEEAVLQQLAAAQM